MEKGNRLISGVWRIIKYTLLGIFLVWIGLFIWAISKTPSHDRNWWEALSVLPRIETSGETFIIYGIRDWTYDASGPVTKEWIDRTYNWSDLEAVWFFMIPFQEWDGFAHTMISFDFKDQEPLMISIEARKEIGEDYKLIDGLMNEYELIYIWGTERDFVGRRVVTQNDPVYMYPLDINLEFAKQFLQDLFTITNTIYDAPAFYNTIGNNCTNRLAISANNAKPGTVPIDIARLLPGFSFDLLYRLGYIDDGGVKEEVRNKYYISDVVKNMPTEKNISDVIREYLHK